MKRRKVNPWISRLTQEDRDQIKAHALQRFNTVTLEWSLGYYAGETIVRDYLPTLSIDAPSTRTLIKVPQEDQLENERLSKEWFEASTHKAPLDDVEKAWKRYQEHRKELKQKYLPKEVPCYLTSINPKRFNPERGMEDFKDGVITTLWNSDVCYYSLKPEDIMVEFDQESIYYGPCLKVTLTLPTPKVDHEKH
jgi:hypothetical protein